MRSRFDEHEYQQGIASGDIIKNPDRIDLKKIYLEPTTNCNLSCTTCMRNSWDEPSGMMSMETFNRLMDKLSEVKSMETIAFWGIGEPLGHPCIADMILCANKLGLQTELITNAMPLDNETAEKLIDSGLNTLVISLDSTSHNLYSEIRTDSDLGILIKNVKRLNELKLFKNADDPEIGIEFVVMKKNISELKKLREMAITLNARFIIVTNVLPYTEEYKDEILYWLSATNTNPGMRLKGNPEIILPKIDTRSEYVCELKKINAHEQLSGYKSVTSFHGRCPFVIRGSMSVTWNGNVSPCIPLMHSYNCYVMGREKRIEKLFLGNIENDTPLGIWNKPEYKELRKKLIRFDFSPCIGCGGCDLSKSNKEDCIGNTHPACGDCLWAKGIIQCP